MPEHRLTQWKGEHDHIQNIVELKLFSHGIYRLFFWRKLMIIFIIIVIICAKVLADTIIPGLLYKDSS